MTAMYIVICAVFWRGIHTASAGVPSGTRGGFTRHQRGFRPARKFLNPMKMITYGGQKIHNI